METSNYKIAVFTDLKDPQQKILRNSIGLARKLNGDIEVFHAKNPAEVVKTQNQLSARRTINRMYAQTDNAIQKLIADLADEHQIRIRHTFAMGNLKTEIAEFIDKVKPDLIVLGKRKSPAYKVFGDGITNFILKKFKGMVMIATDTKALDVDGNLSLGLLNSNGQALNNPIAEKLLKQSRDPLKSFSITKGPATSTTGSELDGVSNIAYVFEHNDNAINNLSQYITRSKVDLLLVERNRMNSWDSSVKKAISDLHVNVLMANT